MSMHPESLPRRRALRAAPDVITAMAVLVIWRVFFPALMSADSIAQFGQALQGPINDWHPPLMTVVLRLTYSAGAAIGLLMLAQCAAGAFGVRALADGVLRLLWPARFSAEQRAWRSLLVLLALLVPLSPLAFYLMTFWKDAWAMVLMLWFGAVAIDMRVDGPTWQRAVVAAALGAALAMVRHNAIVALPALALVLFVAMPAPRRRAAIAAAALPFLLFAAATTLIDRLYDVQEKHVDAAIMVLDLVGVCARAPADCRELPWTQSHIRDPAALARFDPTDMGLVYWQAKKPVDLSMQSDYPRLRAEYELAWRRFPMQIARLKVEGYEHLLGLHRTYYLVHGSIVDNPYGLVLNRRFARPRDWLLAKVGQVGATGWRWLFCAHVVWLVANLGWLVGLAILGWRRRDARSVLLGCILLVPLAYYLSYLAAAPVEDFRFMYPATLFVQGVTLSALAGAVQKPTGRAP